MPSLRILHTSDWHLGHTLLGQDRAPEHDAFLRWLLDQFETYRPDALLVCGDIYQTSNPPASAEQRFYDFLVHARTRFPYTQIVITAGNHDSPARLETARSFYKQLNVTVIGSFAWNDDGPSPIVRLSNRDGHPAWVVAMPFLRPADLNPEHLKAGDLTQAVDAQFAQVLDKVASIRAPGEPLIVMGHAHLRGGQTSEHSERIILRGDQEALPVSVLGQTLSYGAFGHLHLAQSVDGGPAPVHYCGSPIPLSMAEASYPHQVLLVDFEGSTCTEVRSLPVPRHVGLIRFRAEDPMPVEETLKALRSLDYDVYEPERRPFMEVNVFVDTPSPNLKAEIEAAIAHLDVRLIKITRKHAAELGTRLGDTIVEQELGDLNPEDVMAAMHRQKHGREPSDALISAFRDLRSKLDRVGP